ncbi:hypothetical protein KKB44_02505 [Candidatus Micrarchaeota archaeon]|nr:hypothetical protein [Candidatus Micrarchaeota archaeon]
MNEIEKEFENTSKLLLGTGLSGLEEYGEWLGKRVPLPKKTTSAITGKEVWVPPSFIYMGKSFNLENVISLDEMKKIEESPYKADDLADASIKQVLKLLNPVRYHCGNFRYRTSENIQKSSGAGDGRNIWYCEDVYLGVKNIAYANYALFCQNGFGCHGIIRSSFVIHAYNSSQVTRCFEVDGCSNSSGLLFCHNCENVHDSMFCFNAKNLQHAIGNVPFSPEQYKKIKSMILAQIIEELEKTKNLKYDIFNIG